MKKYTKAYHNIITYNGDDNTATFQYFLDCMQYSNTSIPHSWKYCWCFSHACMLLLLANWFVIIQAYIKQIICMATDTTIYQMTPWHMIILRIRHAAIAMWCDSMKPWISITGNKGDALSLHLFQSACTKPTAQGVRSTSTCLTCCHPLI